MHAVPAEKLETQVDEALSWGVQESSAVVVEARELLQAIANDRYWAAVKVQGQYRKLLALRELERRRRQREREIADIFGELGSAFGKEVSKNFEHNDEVDQSSFSDDHKRLKHIYNDADELERAHRIATKVQAYARRFLDRRSYITLLQSDMKRRDHDGELYSYNEFTELYGGDVEWQEALMATYGPDVTAKPRRRGRTMERRETRRKLNRKNTKAVIPAYSAAEEGKSHRKRLSRKFTRKRTVAVIAPKRERRRYGQKTHASPEELHWAAEENDVETCKVLLDPDPNPKSRTPTIAA